MSLNSEAFIHSGFWILRGSLADTELWLCPSYRQGPQESKKLSGLCSKSSGHSNSGHLEFEGILDVV